MTRSETRSYFGRSILKIAGFFPSSLFFATTMGMPDRTSSALAT